jgi:tetratricopeptide (TPR) repeat protein
VSPSAHDFLLEATPVAAGYRIVLTSLTTGKVLGEAVTAPLDHRRLQNLFLRPLQDHAAQGAESGLTLSLGRELAAFLLPAALLIPLCAALLRHPDPNASIHFRLAIRDPKLAALPWEYLFLESTPPFQQAAGFLCLNPRFHLVRRSPTPKMVSMLPTDMVRTLIVWADPCSPAYPALGSAEQEANELQALLQKAPECRGIAVRSLPHATPAGLEKALRSWQPHVLHFIGHGDSRQEQGQLILEGERIGVEKPVFAQDLAEWIRYPAFRLAVLSACRTATLGASLTQAGVPAVVAMQLPWRDKVAVLFARTFYSALMASAPLEEALCQARQGLCGLPVDWGIPALFLAGDASRLLDLRTPTPTNLPYPPNLDFVGRESIMESIRDRLQSSEGRPVALVGMGGVGKTQLALEYAHRSLADYPEGVFWIEAADTASVLAGYAGLGRFFQIPLEIDSPALRVKDRLQQLSDPALLIYNNLTSRTDLSLLPSVGRCHIIATTREAHLAYPRFHRVDVSPLGQEAALRLLQTRRTAETLEEQTAARAIVARTGRLPLALALVAHHVHRHGSFAEYWERLNADPLKTLNHARKRFSPPTGHDGSLFDTLNLSYLDLDAAGAHLLQAAACFAPQGISLDLLQQAADIPTRLLFLDALADLEAFCLINRDADHWVSLHELVRDFALDQAGENRKAHVERAARILTQRLRAANERMDWIEVRPEWDHCRAVVELCERCDVQEPLCDLLEEMAGYLFEHADLLTANECYTRCLKMAVVRCGALSKPTARLRMRLAHTLLHQGDLPAATEMGRAALTAAENLWEADAPELADYFNDMGYILKRGEALDEALTHYDRALFLCSHRNSVTHASVSNNIGTLHESLGNLSAARMHLERALKIGEEMFGTRHPKTAIRLNNIGRVTLAQGNAAEALGLHSRALEIDLATFEARHPDVATCHYYLGRAQESLGQTAASKNHYLEALETYLHFYGPDHKTSRTVQDCLAQIEK